MAENTAVIHPLFYVMSFGRGRSNVSRPPAPCSCSSSVSSVDPIIPNLFHAISFVSAGFSYNLHQLPEEKIHEAKKIVYKHPKHLFQMGYSSLVFRYGINNTFSKIPVFWGGESEVNHGISFDYRQNVFHTSKYFSLDLGVGASFFKSNINKESFLCHRLNCIFCLFCIAKSVTEVGSVACPKLKKKV